MAFTVFLETTFPESWEACVPFTGALPAGQGAGRRQPSLFQNDLAT